MTPSFTSPSDFSVKLDASALADLCTTVGLDADTLTCLLLSPSDNVTPTPSLMRRLPAAPFEPLSAAEIAVLNTVFATRDGSVAGSQILNSLLRRFGHNEPWDRIPHVEAVRGHYYRGVGTKLWSRIYSHVQENAGIFTPSHVRGFEAIAQAECALVTLKGRRA